MIKIDTKFSLVKKKPPKIAMEIPLFARYKPNFDEIEKIAKKYKKQKNLVVIGNGGSINSFEFFHNSLKPNKNVYVVSSMEPDFLFDIKSKCKKKDTVIVAISKSGTTVAVLESLLYFIDYPSIIVLTENKRNAIKQIQEEQGFDFVEHPVIGGRYAGLTTCGLLPAAIADIDIRGLWKGASSSYKKYDPTKKNNNALNLAHTFFELDKKGFSEIFMPIYSSRLMGSSFIITQLIHESVGKERKGQTLVSAFAPESQHHTNQRFFGGKRNMLGCFVVEHDFERRYDIIKVPSKIKDIKLRDSTLDILSNNFYAKALYAEFIGTRKDANSNKIPNVVLELTKLTPEVVGEYLGFWQYVVVYLSKLNNVDPFNQPQVESSKQISYEYRKKMKKR